MPDRTFNEFSASADILLHPQAANDKLAIAFNVTRAGVQSGIYAGNFAFEIGDPRLGSEHALGFDVGVRVELGTVAQARVTAARMDPPVTPTIRT